MITKILSGPLFADNCDRANDDDPGDYVERVGDWDIVSNRLEVTDASASLLEIVLALVTEAFICSTASNNLGFGHNPGLMGKLTIGAGRNGYEGQYDSSFGNIRILRWSSGSSAVVGGSGPGGGVSSGAGHMQFYFKDSVQKFRLWDGVAWKTVSRTDGVYNGISGNVALASATPGGAGNRTKRHDNILVLRDPFFRTEYLGGTAPGWKARVLGSTGNQLCIATNAAGVAIPDITSGTTTESQPPVAGFHRLQILDTTNRPIDEIYTVWPGETFSWDGKARAYAPTLAALQAPTGQARFSVTAMEHIEGVTTQELYGPLNDLPFPKHLRVRVATSAAPTVPILEFDSQSAVVDLAVLLDTLAVGSYSVTAAWYDGKYDQEGIFSTAITLTVVAEQPAESGGDYTATCTSTGLNLTINPYVGEHPQVGIYIQMGRTVGTTFSGVHSEVVFGAGAITRNFPLFDRGLNDDTGFRMGVRWKRIISIGGIWSLTPFEFITCETEELQPIPFFVTPPGKIYDNNFTLEWDYKGPVDFWTGKTYTHRIRHSTDRGLNWTELAASSSGKTYNMTGVAALALGWHLIEVTTLGQGAEAGSESTPNYFAFRRGDPADEIVKDFKAMGGMPADVQAMHAGTGGGTDGATLTFEAGVGLVATHNVTNSDSTEAAWAFTDLGQPQEVKGVLAFSERVSNEGWSTPNRFAPVLFQIPGMGFALTGNGVDRSQFGGIFLQKASGWYHGWPYTSNPRGSGASSSKGGINAEFNRINFGSIGPYVYGIIAELRSQVRTKRVGNAAASAQGGSSNEAASRFFPSNRVSGSHSYQLIFEFTRGVNQQLLRYMLIGPDAVPSDWQVVDLAIVDDLGGKIIPCGFCGLSFSNYFGNGGRFEAHSLVVSTDLDCACPPISNEPTITEVSFNEGTRQITLKGNQPTPDTNADVRYMLFEQDEYTAPLTGGDSGWIDWTSAGYTFAAVPVGMRCVVVRYGWRDLCADTKSWAPAQRLIIPGG